MDGRQSNVMNNLEILNIGNLICLNLISKKILTKIDWGKNTQDEKLYLGSRG